MAHSCPNCGQACYCGGDIDDCLMDESDDRADCGHCPSSVGDDVICDGCAQLESECLCDVDPNEETGCQ